MGTIRNTETDEVVFESDDPAALNAKADEVVAAWREGNPDAALPFVVEGFDSGELTTGVAHPPEGVKTPPAAADRLEVDTTTGEVIAHGSAEPPVAEYGPLAGDTAAPTP